MPDDDYEPDLRKARQAVLHGLSNAVAIVFHGMESLEARLGELKVTDGELRLILADMRVARARAMQCFEALRKVC